MTKKSSILIVIFLILVAAIALLWWLTKANSTVFDSDRISLNTYKVGGEHTANGLLVLPFRSAAGQISLMNNVVDTPMNLNVLLAGRWIINNIPLLKQDDLKFAFPFKISSLDVNTFDTELVFGPNVMTGQDLSGIPKGAERQKLTLNLQVVDLASNNCQYAENWNAGDYNVDSLPQDDVAAEMFNGVSYYDSKVKENFTNDGQCLNLPKSGRVISLKDLTDVKIFLFLTNELGRFNSVWLRIGQTSAVDSNFDVFQVVGTYQDSQNMYIQGYDPTVTDALITYRLEEGRLKAFVQQKDGGYLNSALLSN